MRVTLLGVYVYRWGHRDGIEKLRAIKFNSDCLREYAEEVISELSAGE